jgi:hypothetical protein
VEASGSKEKEKSLAKCALTTHAHYHVFAPVRKNQSTPSLLLTQYATFECHIMLRHTVLPRAYKLRFLSWVKAQREPKPGQLREEPHIPENSITRP